MTEDEKEEEFQKIMKISANPGLAWGGRRRRLKDDDDDDEDEEIEDMRSFTEQLSLNNTLDKMILVMNNQL